VIRTNEGIFERDVYIDANRVVHVFDSEGDPFALDVISDHIEEDLEVADTSSLDFIKAPMPCTLAKVNFKIGDEVKKGDTLLIMEAMKMEHTVKASRDGVVKEVNY
jgi:3-methylcrotonyl-CoA carboxylase alpha subunit